MQETPRVHFYIYSTLKGDIDYEKNFVYSTAQSLNTCFYDGRAVERSSNKEKISIDLGPNYLVA